MTHALLRGLAVIVFSLIPLGSVAEEAQEAPRAEPGARDIERVIDTLEDPDARAELIRELRVLLEAERGQAEGDGPPTGGRIVDAIGDAVTGAWEALRSIEPRQLLVSIGLSLLIVIAALIVRSIILRLLKRLYHRLISGGEAPAEEVVEMAEIDATRSSAPLDEHGEMPPSIPRLVNLIIAADGGDHPDGGWRHGG